MKPELLQRLWHRSFQNASLEVYDAKKVKINLLTHWKILSYP